MVPAQAAAMDTIAAAMRKVAVVWLAPVGGPAVAAWLLWRDGSAYVVGGRGEQPLPGIEAGHPALVTVASPDTRARVLTWVAAVQRIEPGGPQWEAVVPALLADRLSAEPDAADRWTSDCRVLRLTPTGELAEAGRTLPSSDLAAPPVPTPATTAPTSPLQAALVDP